MNCQNMAGAVDELGILIFFNILNVTWYFDPERIFLIPFVNNVHIKF